MDFATFIESKRQDVTSAEKRLQNKQLVARYGRMFSPASIPNLSAEEFKSFLSFKNNKHWTGIHRQSGLLTRDMERLREALSILVDETKPLKERLDVLFPKGHSGFVKGLGRAVATPILNMVYPDKYGIYNSISERTLEHFGLLPMFDPGSSFAERYVATNEVLNRLAREHGLSLLELDEACWTGPEEEGEQELDESTQIEETLDALQIDVLERFLSDFLVYNWDKTALGKWYELYEEDGDIAQEYRTSVGRIDLLTKDRQSGNWVVIELKRGRSSDVVVGQILRYIGWVQEHIASADECVRGVIIADNADDRLRYALKPLGEKVTLLTYVVQFDVQKVDL